MAEERVESIYGPKIALREGAAGQPPGALREQLGLPTSATDRDAAFALVAKISGGDLSALTGTDRASQTDPRGASLVEPVHSADASFLGQLGSSGKDALRELDDATDLSTLLAVLRAGRLFQRRAAALRLGSRMAEVRALPSERQREVFALLEGLRDPEVAFELRACREALPGPAGKEARDIERRVEGLMTEMASQVRAYWDGSLAVEPFAALSGDARAQLLLHAREMPDMLAAHVAALIEDIAPPDPAARRTLVAGVCFSGDPRLVPALINALETGDGDLVIDAARALSRVEDARVWPALLAAYERSVVHAERLALGAALGRLGDVRAAPYARERLGDDDEHIRLLALEALGTTGEPEDMERVLPRLRAADPLEVSHAAQVLGRIGDGRALAGLRRTAQEGPVGAVRAAAEEALEQVRARLALRGEEPDASEATGSSSTQQDALSAMAARAPKDSPIVVVAAFRHYLIGRLWQLLGASGPALRRFEKASSVRPSWTLPLLVAAMLYASRDQYAQALAAFRRALDLDRSRVERNALMVRTLARCFLRRSEQVEREGRATIARGLLDEVMSLDLRRVPSSLRFEIGRRHEALRLSGAPP